MRYGFNNIMNVLDTFQEMFEQKFNDYDFVGRHFSPIQFPKTKISRVEDEVKFVAEIPGVKKEDIKLEINGDVITLSGKKNNPLDGLDENDNTEKETFNKTIKLPCEVNAEKVEARYENGLLFVTLPINEDGKSRNITIN